MGKPHPFELRARVVAYVDLGHSHRKTAKVFFVSIKFVNDMIKLRRETGSLAPKKQGNTRPGKLAPYVDWVKDRLEEKGDLTLDELCLELCGQHGVKASRGSVGKWLHRLGLSNKKNTHRQRAEAL
jgi:transposase